MTVWPPQSPDLNIRVLSGINIRLKDLRSQQPQKISQFSQMFGTTYRLNSIENSESIDAVEDKV